MPFDLMAIGNAEGAPILILQYWYKFQPEGGASGVVVNTHAA
jgi:hypothetical protein